MRLTRRQAIGVAIACGVLAALLSYAYLKRAAALKQPAAPTTATVVYSRVDAEPGTRVTPAMLGTRTVSIEQAPADAVKSPQEVAGWVAVTRISAGDIITRSNVRQPSAALGLAFLVPEGMRAVTVALDQVSGVAGLAKPGDHVDVIATFDLPQTNTTITRTVLQDVEVLAVGSQVVPAEAEQAEGAQPPQQGEGARPQQTKVEPTATLAVTPEEAEKLVLADSEGKIRLSLRRAGDHSYVQLPAAVNWNVIGYRPPPERTAVGPAPVQQAPGWYPAPTTAPPPTGAPGAGPSPGPPPVPSPTQARAPEKPPVEVYRGSQREVIVP